MPPEPPREIIVSAAHAGLSGAVPVGGGAAVVNALLRAWSAAPPCPITVYGLGDRLALPGITYHRVPAPWPRGAGPDDLVKLGELAYAAVATAFEREVTERVLATAGPGACVLANDLSEGPDFAALAAAGLPVVTLWHVDVVDYFARFYLGGLRPELLARAHRALGPAGRLLPRVLKLVFQKQADCVRWSARQVVPSSRMREVIERCYPGAGARVAVVPWGAWDTPADEPAIAAEVAALRATYQLADGETLLVTLSRLSPEKGLDRLLRALRHGERAGEMPAGVRLWLAGEPAFMRGERTLRELRRLAGELRRCRVDFLGYAAGARKQAVWRLADLFVMPSRHESYGLTLAEALRAGLPAVSTAHYSAGDLVTPEVGRVVPNAPEREVPALLWAALRELLVDRDLRRRLADGATRRAATLDFAGAAGRVLELCGEAVLSGPPGA